MFDSKFTISIAIAICYFAMKFLEMRFVLKEAKPLKVLFRDSVIVSISSFLGLFILDQIEPLTSVMSGGGGKAPAVFVNEPDF